MICIYWLRDGEVVLKRFVDTMAAAGLAITRADSELKVDYDTIEVRRLA